MVVNIETREAVLLNVLISFGGKDLKECAWSLLPDTSCDLPYILSDSIPTYDELCRQFIGCVYSCMHCGSDLFRFVIK